LNVLRMVEAYADPEESTDDLQASRATEAFALVQTAREAAGLDAPDEAIAAYRRAVEAAPTEALILLEFGRFLYEQHMNDEAAEMIETSTRHGSGGYGGFYYLAQVLYASRRMEEAAEAAAKARELQPTRPGVIDLSANIARKIGRLEEAIELSRMHLELEPGSAQSRERLQNLIAQANAQQGVPDGKREAIKAILGGAATGRRRARR
jgi:predicted Zn-dependent protease